MRAVLTACASVAIVVVALIFVFLGREGLPVLWTVPLSDLLSDRWVPASLDSPHYGIRPLLSGSVLVTVLAMVIAVPLGVVAAVYVSEFAGDHEREVLKQLVEVIAGLPSVVLGFFGMVVLAPAMKAVFGISSGLTALTGALLLAYMALPTILTIAEDALRTVPRSLKDASLALGASHWQTTWQITVPAARSGIVGAVLLGMGRVVGETMAVMMVTGNAAIVTASPFESVRTLTATIAAEMGETPVGSEHHGVLFLLGLILLSATLTMNLYARRVR